MSAVRSRAATPAPAEAAQPATAVPSAEAAADVPPATNSTAENFSHYLGVALVLFMFMSLVIGLRRIQGVDARVARTEQQIADLNGQVALLTGFVQRLRPRTLGALNATLA